MVQHEALAAAARIHGRKLFFGVLCGLALSGCAHPVRPMLTDHVIVISGRITASEDRSDTTRKMLVVAARMTLNHGFRYFAIVGLSNASNPVGMSSLQPGSDVTIRVYREGEINPRNPGIWDAENIGAGTLPDVAR